MGSLETVGNDPEYSLPDIKCDTGTYSILEEDEISEYTDESEEHVEPTTNSVQCNYNIANLQNHRDIDQDQK